VLAIEPSRLDSWLNGDIANDLADASSTPTGHRAADGGTAPPRVLVFDRGDSVATTDLFVAQFVAGTGGQVIASDTHSRRPEAVLIAAVAGGANLVALGHRHFEIRNTLLPVRIGIMLLE
jgi:hypothetical protein